VATSISARKVAELLQHRLLGNQHRHRRALRVVVLAGDVEDVGADDLGHIGKDLGQAIGVVLIVDVLDVVAALFFGHRIADVVDVEAQRLGQVVEALQAKTGEWFNQGDSPWRYEASSGGGLATRVPAEWCDAQAATFRDRCDRRATT
jgi:hypothetical protein